MSLMYKTPIKVTLNEEFAYALVYGDWTNLSPQELAVLYSATQTIYRHGYFSCEEYDIRTGQCQLTGKAGDCVTLLFHPAIHPTV